jgi:hypothetical protein
VVLSAVRRGQPTKWLAKIVRTEGVVDEKSRVTYVVARVNDPYRLHSDGPALPVGTFVSAEIQGTVAENIVRVPRSVVRGSDKIVLVDDQDTLRIRQVDIIRSDENYIYVTGAELAGARVVQTALETPVNGAPVRIAPGLGPSGDDKSIVAGGEDD